MPIGKEIEMSACISRLRTIRNEKKVWDGLGSNSENGHRLITDKIIKQCNIRSMEKASFQRYRQPIETFPKGDFLPAEGTIVFTDGSKMENTGAGWLITKENKIIEEKAIHCVNATVYQAEVLANT